MSVRVRPCPSPVELCHQPNHIIDRVTEMRDLGVIMDKKLSFAAHTEYITNKSNAVLQFVKRQSPKFDTDVKKILYSALVRSNLEFACPIWSSHHEIYKTKIESIQKQMVMFLNGDDKRRIDGNYILLPYIERCNAFDLATLARRRTNAIVIFIHSIITGKYKCNFLRSNISIYNGIRTLRNPEFIRVKADKTDHSTYSSFNNAYFIFNHAALFIDPTISSFDMKKQIRKLPDKASGPWSNVK